MDQQMPYMPLTEERQGRVLETYISQTQETIGNLTEANKRLKILIDRMFGGNPESPTKEMVQEQSANPSGHIAVLESNLGQINSSISDMFAKIQALEQL